MTGVLYRLGRLCGRRRLLVLGLWIAVAGGLVAWAAITGEDTNDNVELAGTDSQRATDLLDRRFPKQANGSNPILFEAPQGRKLTDDRYADAIRTSVSALRRDRGVETAVSPLTGRGSDALTGDKRTGYIAVTLGLNPSELTEEDAERIIARADAPLERVGLTPAVGGYLGQEVSKPSTEVSERVGLAAAVVVLLFTFGTVVAMGLPIVTAVLALASTLSVIALLTHLVDVPTVGPTLATMIGLGVGIDYALFLVTRHRAQLAEGMDPAESAARAVATAGGAVVFAGVTVVIALASLALAGIPLVTTLGYTAAIAVLCAVLAAVTLLPAVLSLVGRRIESLRLPLGRHVHDHRPHGWARWARFVASHPWPALILATLVLALLSIPLLNLHLGQEDVGAMPKSTTARVAYDINREGFGPGNNGPLLIAVKLERPAKNNQAKLERVKHQAAQEQRKQQEQEQEQVEQLTEQLEAQGVPPDEAASQAQSQVEQQQAKSQSKQRRQAQRLQNEEAALRSPASDPRLVSLQKDLQKQPGVKSVSPPLVNSSGDAAVYTLIPTTAPSSTATEDLIDDLRGTVLPKDTAGEGLRAHVGGRAAGFVDLADRIGDKLPQVILIVIGLSFLVLLLGFRSVLIPLKAGLMNLLSIGASLGVVTAVFQEGFAHNLIGLDHAVPVESFVPLMMFAILFGLSMDYEVFLMTQMREHYKRSGDNHEAVVAGLATTGRVITSAALIMVSVFCAFIINGDPTVKQFGVGLAVAIAIDATVVRCMLVPALMTLIGKGNWWMPRWLARLTPRIEIEGEEWFRARDTRQPAPEPPIASAG